MAVQTIEEMETELAQSGVKGMKWGVRKSGKERSEKQMNRLNNRADKGDAIISKVGGSARDAGAHIAKRRVITGLALTTGGMLAAKALKDKPAIARGATMLADYANAGLAIRDARDLNRVFTADKRARTS